MVELVKPAPYSRPTYAVDFIPGHTREGVFLGSPAFDATVHLSVVLGSEAWAAKRRLKIVESLVAKNVMPTAARIEAYMPTADEEKAWTAERDQFIKDRYTNLIEVAAVSPPIDAKHT
jgi:hypothetical protein